MTLLLKVQCECIKNIIIIVLVVVLFHLEDLNLFVSAAALKSFSVAAREARVSPAQVSKE